MSYRYLSKLRGSIVNVREFGAKGDGTTNDTAAMQAAHDTGSLIYYPAGTYKFTTITMASGGIVGDGQTETILSSTNTGTEDLISCTGASVGGPANGLTFRDFQVLGTLDGSNPAKASGGAIAVKPSSGENSYASFYNVTTNYVPTGIRMVAASLWNITACNFLAYDVAGVDVANSNDKDSGDSTIQGCVFSNPYTTGAAVLQRSSGGLRVIGNKMLGGGEGYKLSYESTAGVVGTGATSILFLVGNSIENMNGSGVSLTRSSGTQTFKNIVIQGNEFAGQSFHISSDSNTFIEQMVVSGNVFQMPGSGLTYGIALVAVNDLSVSGNVFRGNGGTPLALGLTSCVNVKIGSNVYANIADPITLTTAGANNVIHGDSQSGVATTSSSGWSTYGTALFQSPVTTVTFTQPYLETPAVTDVSLEPGAGSGEVGAIVVAVTKTQLQFVAVSAVNSIAAVVNWKVWGVL